MKLDSRILEGKKPLTALDTDVAKEFIGKQCYFADNIEDFFNLDNTNVLKGFLTDIDDDEMISGCFKSNGIRSSFFGHFIMPCEWVKEPKKKYRPFSLEEFLKIFDIGDQIDFKIKNSDEVKCAMFTGYITDVDRIDDKTPGAVELMLGVFHYSLFSLFEDFELFFEDKWQPFGIEEQV